MPSTTTFGTWVRARRRATDLTLAACALQIGCDADTLRKIERDVRTPSKALVHRILAFFQVPLDEQPALLVLACGVKPTAPQPPDQALDDPASEFVDRQGAAMGPQSLPVPVTPLIGRDQEVAHVRQIFDQPTTRLITLVGPPGVGKTRLALAVGHALQEHAWNVAWIPLSPITDPAHLLPTIVRAFEPTHALDDDPLPILWKLLGQRRWVLLLDNLEHLVDGVGGVAELLLTLETVQIIATSRESLLLPGEHLITVAPLTLPAPTATTPEDLLAATAVQLFLHHRMAVTGATTLATEEIPTVVALCRALDGLPLAVELAARQLRQRSLLELQRDLTTVLPTLAYRWHGRDLHRQSLWVAIESSIQALPVPCQHLFFQLSLWRGSWTVEAVAQVLGTSTVADQPLADFFRLLAEKHVILRLDQSAPDQPPRWTMLQVMHQYAWCHLSRFDTVECLERRHAETYLARVHHVVATLRHAGHASNVGDLEPDLPNIRRAMEWAVVHDPALAAAYGESMGAWWVHVGGWQEANQWLAQIRAVQAHPQARAAIDQIWGRVLDRKGRYDDAVPHYIEAMRWYQDHGDRAALAWLLYDFGWNCLMRRAYTDAASYLDQAVLLADAVPDRHFRAQVLQRWGTLGLAQHQLDHARQNFEAALRLAEQEPRIVASALGSIGTIALLHGNYVEARQQLTAALAYDRHTGYQWGIAHNTSLLSVALLHAGDDASAWSFARESLRVWVAEQHGEKTCWMVEVCAVLLARVGAYQRGVQLFRDAQQWRMQFGGGLPTIQGDRLIYDQLWTRLTEAVPAEVWTEAWADGESVDVFTEAQRLLNESDRGMASSG